MKKFTYYLICWFASIALFNVVAFTTPEEIAGVSKYAGSFWVVYGFTMVAFIGHLIYAKFSFAQPEGEYKNINTPVTVLSFIELGIMAVVGTVCMFIPELPKWIAAIICTVILAFSVILMTLIRATGEKEAKGNKKLNRATANFRQFTDTAQMLIQIAGNEEIKALATKVYEAIRYSDQMTSEATAQDEVVIETKLNELTAIITDTSKTEEIKTLTTELLNLVQIRNNKVKINKRKI